MASTTKRPRTNKLLSEDLIPLRDFACQLADAAAEITLRYFREPVDVENKATGPDFDPVSIADKQAEQVIRSLISEAFPEHSVIGEELEAKSGSSAYVWIIDPIDGTRGFLAGVPLWGTLIALNNGTKPILGLVDQPYLQERFIGIQTDEMSEASLTRRGKTTPLSTRAGTQLSDAIITCTTPAMFKTETERRAFDELEQRCRLSRYSLDCYGYCLLAAGTIDLVVEADLAPYDIQALIPIIQAAGGKVTDWQGAPPYQGGQVLAAANEKLHGEALEILSQAAHG